MILKINIMMETRKSNTAFEIRCADNPVVIEQRGEGDETQDHVVGYALKFNSLSRTIGWFREKIDRGALENADMNDVVALFNHNIDMVLARTISKTLTLEVDDAGLRYSFSPPNTTAGRDLVESLKRGDVQHSSFSFSISEDKWEEDEEGNEIRTVLKIKRLYDVSPVVNPAYLQATSELAKRSYDEWKESQKPKHDDLKDAEAELNIRKILL
jgi:uncharacterized protein